MLRTRLADALKRAMKEKDALAVSTVRLILARLKERDIDARPKGNVEGIVDADIEGMMQGMIKQRRESIELYEKGKRVDLADKERGEIAIIERFLPKALSEAETETVVKETIAAVGALSVRDMGRVMTALKEKYAGQLDPAKASQTVKRLLA